MLVTEVPRLQESYNILIVNAKLNQNEKKKTVGQ